MIFQAFKLKLPNQVLSKMDNMSRNILEKKKNQFSLLYSHALFFFFLSLDTKVPRKNERLTEVQMKMETPDTVAQKN